MIRLSTALAALFISIVSHAASLRFEGARFTPVAIEVPASTGIAMVFVVNSTDGLSAVYTASSPSASVEVAVYDLRGAAYAEPVDGTLISRDGAEVTVSALQPDRGYAFNENGRTTYYWIADYSARPFSISAINAAPEQECDRTFLVAEGSAPAMMYYSVSGRGYEIDRQIELSYTTLMADQDNTAFISSEKSISFKHVDGTFSVEAPLCDTYFQLTGDRFLRAWGMEEEITSPRFTTTAVSAVTSATQTSRDSDNEIKVEAAIGGSAPVEVAFKASASDAAIFTQWQMARDEDFQNIFLQIADLDFTYTFTDMGTFFVRFIAADASGRCEFFSETYTVTIGESRLLCPNAFSPGASEGVNDEWKVSYKSIIDFECYIFNRWGEKMAEFHDPSQGWDGKYGGKLVPAGVYYYVIKATGSDGKKYNLSGDINILRYTK